MIAAAFKVLWRQQAMQQQAVLFVAAHPYQCTLLAD
jgi:hypothetical protein